jgi:hypothetical protein
MRTGDDARRWWVNILPPRHTSHRDGTLRVKFQQTEGLIVTTVRHGRSFIRDFRPGRDRRGASCSGSSAAQHFDTIVPEAGLAYRAGGIT